MLVLISVEVFVPIVELLEVVSPFVVRFELELLVVDEFMFITWFSYGWFQSRQSNDQSQAQMARGDIA